MGKRLWVVGLMACGLVGWRVPHAEAVILINEVLADPDADANRDGEIHAAGDEFIELVNTATASVSLAGWSLADRVRTRHLFSATASIPGTGFFVVFGGGVPHGFSHVAVASGGTLGLNNGGDTVSLFAADTSLVDVLTYGAEGGRDASLTRAPDASGPFALHSSVSAAAFSPGTTLDGFAHLPGRGGDPAASPAPADSTVAPEPSSLALLGIGLLGFPLRRRRLNSSSLQRAQD